MENPGAVNSSSPEIRRGESSPGCAFLPGLFGGGVGVGVRAHRSLSSDKN